MLYLAQGDIVMNSGFKDALNDSGMTMYSLSKQTGLPYTTINRLVNEKLSINNCNAGAVFKIASALGVQMEVLMMILTVIMMVTMMIIHGKTITS